MLAGNSIGGFSAPSAAAALSVKLKPHVGTADEDHFEGTDCGGLVLLNSAGRIATEGLTMEKSYTRRTCWFRRQKLKVYLILSTELTHPSRC